MLRHCKCLLLLLHASPAVWGYSVVQIMEQRGVARELEEERRRREE
jgi:hypothetical protein